MEGEEGRDGGGGREGEMEGVGGRDLVRLFDFEYLAQPEARQISHHSTHIPS